MDYFYFRHALETPLILYTNRYYWEELDVLDNESIQNIQIAVRDVFDRVASTPTNDKARQVVEKVLIAGMNVPYPRDFVMHIQCIIDNTYEVYTDLFYNDIQIEIESITCIQNAWRNCISNPKFKMCRRRLQREFIDLQ